MDEITEKQPIISDHGDPGILAIFDQSAITKENAMYGKVCFKYNFSKMFSRALARKVALYTEIVETKLGLTFLASCSQK